MNEDDRIYTIKGDSVEDCKEKLFNLYRNNYEPAGYRTEYEPYGFLKLQKRAVTVYSYRVNHKKSYNPDNYFTYDKNNEEDELEKNRLAILQQNQATLISSQMKEVTKTIEELKAEVKNQLQSYNASNSEQHETIARIDEILEQNEFSASYIRMIEENIRATFSLEQLENFPLVEQYVVDWIGDSISIAPKRIFRPPHVIIIVGPTGVGKTTTIEKMAANVKIDAKKNQKPRPVLCIMTIDIMKAGALEQLQRVGEILKEEIKKAEKTEDVQQIYEENKDQADYIFIDTSGYSPNDADHIASMKKILDVQMNPDIYLSVSASTKTSDLVNIFRNYEPFGYESVIITKTDETKQIGNVISVLWDKHKSVSYITDGQGIPSDIKPARVIDILERLSGFDIDVNHLEERFGEK